MYRTILLAKIHNCTLTAANINYVGSISIDQVLLDKSGILPYEQVQVAARLGILGDRLIIMSYGQFTTDELKTFSPTVVLVDEKNRLLEVRHYDDLLSSYHS